MAATVHLPPFAQLQRQSGGQGARPGRTSPASGSLLAGDELVRPTEEDLGGQVPALFAAEGAFDRDGLKRKFPDAGRHIAAATFAGDHEGFAG